MSLTIAVPAEMPAPWGVSARDAGLDVVEAPAAPGALPDDVRTSVRALLAAELPLPRIADLLQAFPELAWVHVTSAGVDRLDLRPFQNRGIALTNSSGCYDIPVAEHVLGCLVAHARRFLPLRDAQRAGTWARADAGADTLAHATVGIVGFGSIGQEVARLAKAFRMRVEAVKRHVTGKRYPNVDRLHDRHGLERVLKVADHVVVTLPLTAETRGLLDADRLALLKPGASLVNVGRGALIDEAALTASLSRDRPGAAYLDVFGEEPLPAGHPFWTHERVFVTPHVSWQAPQLERWELDLFRKECERFLRAQGEVARAKLINTVDLARGY